MSPASSATAFALTATLLAAAHPAHAREDWTRRPPGRFKLGPLYLTPKVQLRQFGVDDNVFRQLERPVSDTTVVLRPSLTGALPVGRRIRLLGSGYLDFNYFRTQGTERSTDFGAEGAGELDFGPFTFFGGGGGLQARQRAGIDLDERITRQETFGAGGVETRLGSRFEITVRGEERQLRFGPSRVRGAGLQRALDRNSRGAALEVRSKLTVFTTAVATAEVIEDTFVRQRDAGRVTRSYRVLGGLDVGLGAIVSGTVMAGVRHIPGSSAGSVAAYTGPALRVVTTIPVRSVALVTLVADRDVYYAAAAQGPTDALRSSYVSRRYEGGLDVHLPFGLIGRGTAGFQDARYLLPNEAATIRVPKVDHLYSATGTLLKRVGESVRVGATVAWERRVSTLPLQSYEGMRYGLTGEVAP